MCFGELGVNPELTHKIPIDPHRAVSSAGAPAASLQVLRRRTRLRRAPLQRRAAAGLPPHAAAASLRDGAARLRWRLARRWVRLLPRLRAATAAAKRRATRGGATVKAEQSVRARARDAGRSCACARCGASRRARAKQSWGRAVIKGGGR